MNGTVYIIATPIGNLGDITLRAVELLKHVDCVVSEDTRRSKKLLDHFSITTPLISYHDHSPEQKRKAIIGRLKKGESVALISDAGTPLVSDPGYKLIRACIDEEITVTAVPGPSSVVNALAVSGLPPDAFQFLGYLSPKSGKKKKELEMIAQSVITTIVFESCHRIRATMQLLSAIMPDRRIAVCREMTKLYEEIVRGTALDVQEHFLSSEPRGEFVVVIEGLGRGKRRDRGVYDE